MAALFYILACGAVIWFGIMLIRFTRRSMRHSVAVVNSSLEEGLISSGFIANIAYWVLFVLILRICLV